MKRYLEINGQNFEIDVTLGSSPIVTINGQEYFFEQSAIGPHKLQINSSNKSYQFYYAHSGSFKHIQSPEQDFWIKSLQRQRGAAIQSGPSGFEAPMPSKVFKIRVSHGEPVEAGQVLMILEAMKMEHPIKAHKAGTVSKFYFQEGQLVDGGAILLEFKELE